MSKKVAVVDIGSNSVRLVIYDEAGRAPFVMVNEKVTCQLARKMGKTGRLNENGVKQALDVLERFKALIDTHECEAVSVVGTYALREATDGPDFVETVRRKTGLKIDILSGNDEARLSALGVLSAMPKARGITADLGGGSLEFTVIKDGKPGERVSLPLGVVRLQDMMEGGEDIRRYIRHQLKSVDFLVKGKHDNFYPVGGAWRALAYAHMDSQKSKKPLLFVIDRYKMKLAVLVDFLNQLLTGKVKVQAESHPHVSKRRIEQIDIAAILMQEVIDHLKPKTINFSNAGLREGLLFERHLPTRERDQSPVIAACHRMQKRSGKKIETDKLVKWLAPFCQKIFDEDMAEIIQASCLLGDICWNKEKKVQAQTAFNDVLYMPYNGISHRKRVMLASIMCVRYGGTLNGVTKAYLTDEEKRQAEIVGNLLRIAFEFSTGELDLLKHLRADYDSDQKKAILTLSQTGEKLRTDKFEVTLEKLNQALGKKITLSLERPHYKATPD